MLQSTTTSREATAMSVLTVSLLMSWMDASFADAFNAATRDRWGNAGHRRDRRARLLAWQGGICTKCGEVVSADDEVELSHHVPATFHGAPKHAGVFYGNLSTWHKVCNRVHGEQPVTIGTGRATDLKRPDLVFFGTTRDLPRI